MEASSLVSREDVELVTSDEDQRIRLPTDDESARLAGPRTVNHILSESNRSHMPLFVDNPKSVILVGKKPGRPNIELTADGTKFLSPLANLRNLHIVTIIGAAQIGKSSLLSHLFCRAGEIQLRSGSAGEDVTEMSLLAHPNPISDLSKSMLLVNFEGYGVLSSRRRDSVLGFQQDQTPDLEIPIETRIQNIKKESCLLLALASMTSSVILYLYD